MAKQKQNIFKSFAWPVLVAAAMIVIGISGHVSAIGYLASGLVWAAGVAILAINYSKDLEEEMYPYYTQAAGLVIMIIWAAAS